MAKVTKGKGQPGILAEKDCWAFQGVWRKRYKKCQALPLTCVAREAKTAGSSAEGLRGWGGGSALTFFLRVVL